MQDKLDAVAGTIEYPHFRNASADSGDISQISAPDPIEPLQDASAGSIVAQSGEPRSKFLGLPDIYVLSPIVITSDCQL